MSENLIHGGRSYKEINTLFQRLNILRISGLPFFINNCAFKLHQVLLVVHNVAGDLKNNIISSLNITMTVKT